MTTPQSGHGASAVQYLQKTSHNRQQTKCHLYMIREREKGKRIERGVQVKRKRKKRKMHNYCERQTTTV